MGPGQLYQDLQNLLHDLNVVGQISQLIGNLRGSYQVTGPLGWDAAVASRSVSMGLSPSSPELSAWMSLRTRPSAAFLLFRVA